jgi:hypothetical protein
VNYLLAESCCQSNDFEEEISFFPQGNDLISIRIYILSFACQVSRVKIKLARSLDRTLDSCQNGVEMSGESSDLLAPPVVDEQTEAIENPAPLFPGEEFPPYLNGLLDRGKLVDPKLTDIDSAHYKYLYKEQQLYNALKEFLQPFERIQQVFEAHGVPLVVTRSLAVYLWALTLTRGSLIPVKQDEDGKTQIDSELLQDIDCLVPVEMWEEIDAALKELEELGLARVTDKNESEQATHTRGLKSYLFRELTVLDENGNDVMKIEIYGGFGGLVERKKGEIDHILFQAVTVENGELKYMRTADDGSVVKLPNTELRRIKIGDARIRFVVGPGLKASYELEAIKILRRILTPDYDPDSETAAQVSKERQIFQKLTQVEAFLGMDPHLGSHHPAAQAYNRW